MNTPKKKVMELRQFFVDFCIELVGHVPLHHIFCDFPLPMGKNLVFAYLIVYCTVCVMISVCSCVC